MDVQLVILVICFSFLGSMMGTISGLVPGIHVNTLALILLSAYPTIESVVAWTASPELAPLLASSTVVAASVTHSFLDFIPSVFIGAPEEGTVLSVLPGHRLLLRGEGMEAVACAAHGSLVGACTAIVLAAPMQWVMMQGAYSMISSVTPHLLIVILAVLILSEARTDRSRVGWALALSLTSGALGLAVLEGEVPIPGTGSELFPLLTGLFGMPTLLQSAGKRAIPEQRAEIAHPPETGSSLRGVAAGAMVGWLPGISSTAGTIIASLSRRDIDPRRFIAMVSSVGTSATLFSLVALAVAFRGRTGTMVVVSQLMEREALAIFLSRSFAYLLLAALVASLLGHRLTIVLGRLVAVQMGGIDIRALTLAIALLTLLLVTVLTGPEGVVILAVATLVGLVPPVAGVSRVHLTSSLLIPVILFYLGADLTFIP